MLEFSVIVPAFNRSRQLISCLNSLICQNYHNEAFEILVVDNNSSDDTSTEVESFIKKNPNYKIRFFNEKKQGLVHTRHLGVMESTYNQLCFIDDDATAHKNWLLEISKVYEMFPNAAAVGGKIVIQWDSNAPVWIIDYEHLLGKLDYGSNIIPNVKYINGANFSIKRNILIDVGGFNPDQIGKWLIGDGETGLCRKLWDKGYEIIWTPFALVNHHQIVSENATIHDIKRRFINNGSSDVYNLYVSNRGSLTLLLVELLKSIIYYLMQLVRFQFIITRQKEKRKYYSVFIRSYYIAKIRYTIRLFYDKSFRNIIKKKNWINDLEPKSKSDLF